MKSFSLTLYILITCLPTAIKSMEEGKSSYDLFFQLPEHLKTEVENLLKWKIIPFNARKSILEKERKSLSLVPWTPGQSYSINHFQLPFDQPSPDHYMCDASFSYGDKQELFGLVKWHYPDNTITQPEDIQAVTFEGPNENNFALINVRSAQETFLFSFTVPPDDENEADSEETVVIDSINYESFSPEQSSSYFIHALALHRDKNIALLDYLERTSKQRWLTLLQFDEENPRTLASYNSKKFTKGHPFKHLAFVTPSMWIGLTTRPTLYVITNHKNNFEFKKQSIDKSLFDFAVNRQDPRKLLLLDKAKNIYYAHLSASQEDPKIWYKAIGTASLDTQNIYYNGTYFATFDISPTTSEETVNIHQLNEVTPMIDTVLSTSESD